MQAHLLDTVKNFNQSPQHVLVIGDVMLDRYLIGEVNRISPEAPVPVVLLQSQQDRAGGASNVAANLALLGVKTHMTGIVGHDGEAAILIELMNEASIETSGMVRTPHRPTVAKTRILSGHQQMVRLDQESNAPLNTSESSLLLESIKTQLSLEPALVILSDYAKGVLSQEICEFVIKQCKAMQIPVLVDPKGHDYSKYAGATALTPNKKETAEACMTSTRDPALIDKAAALKQQLGLQFLVVTRGEEGISLITDCP